MKIDQFEAMLEAYGADRRRWPADRLAGAERLLGENADARRVFEEARALDRVLAMAPAPSRTAETALADRIARAVGAGQGQPRVNAKDAPARPSAEVIDFAARRHKQAASVAVGPTRLHKAAAALAASLMLGIMFGASDWSHSAIAPLAHAMGLGSELETSVAEMHEASDAALEEELL